MRRLEHPVPSLYQKTQIIIRSQFVFSIQVFIHTEKHDVNIINTTYA